MADKKNKQGFDTRAIHAGQEPDPTTGAIMTPIYTSSTYVHESPGVHKVYDYSRIIKWALEVGLEDSLVQDYLIPLKSWLEKNSE